MDRTQRVSHLAWVLFLTLLFAFLGTTAALAFWMAAFDAGDESVSGFVNAFAGAFFAYLFVRLGEALSRIHQRRELDRNTLARLQFTLNDCLGTLNDNSYVVKLALEKLQPADKHDGHVSVFAMDFHTVPIASDAAIGLLDVALINEVYRLADSARKLNASMASIDRNRARMNDALIEGHLPKEAFLANMVHVRENYGHVRAAIEDAVEDVVRCLAAVRIHLRARDVGALRAINRLATLQPNGKRERELSSEVTALQSELAAVAKESREKIERRSERAGQQRGRPG